MVYVPRTRARAPLMSRLREAVNRLLDDAIDAQDQAKLYTRSSVDLHQLIDSMNDLIAEDEKKGLIYYQKDLVKVAQKLAQLFEKLQGVRLRNITIEEEMGIQMEKTSHVNEEPHCEYDGTLPRISSPDSLDVKEEATLIKEEPLYEVDATPMPYPGTKPQAKSSILDSDDIKKEEPDDEPTPSTSNSHESSLHFDTAAPPRLLDRYEYRVVPSAAGTLTSVRRVIKKPSPYAKPTSRRTWATIPYTPPVALNSKTATGPANSASLRPAVSETTPFAALLRVAAKVPAKPQTNPRATIIKQSAYHQGRLIVRCKYCKTNMDERQLARHIAEQHAVTTPLSASVKWDYSNLILK